MKTVSFRLSDGEFEVLKTTVAASGISQSDFIKQRLFFNNSAEKSDETIADLHRLAKYSANILNHVLLVVDPENGKKIAIGNRQKFWENIKKEGE